MQAGDIVIPSEPKIPLDNYLLELIEDRDVKESSLYMNNVGWLVGELWCDILPKNRAGKEVRMSVARYLGICVHSIYAYKNNRKPMSINMLYALLRSWKNQCNKTHSDFKKKWRQLYERDDWALSTHSKHQKTKLPKYITPKLAYLMGWMVGDGHLKEAHNYLVKISEKSPAQLQQVIAPLFRCLFSIDVPIFRRYMGGYAVQVGSKPVYRFLKNVLKVRGGEVPEIVWKFDAENKKHFLMGVFDSEGYVNSNYRDRRVTISQSNLVFLNKIIALFKDVGIEFKTPVRHSTDLGIWYSIQVRKTSELLKFCSEVGPYHIDKRKKIKLLVEEIEKNRRH